MGAYTDVLYELPAIVRPTVGQVVGRHRDQKSIPLNFVLVIVFSFAFVGRVWSALLSASLARSSNVLAAAQRSLLMALCYLKFCTIFNTTYGSVRAVQHIETSQRHFSAV